MIKEKKFWIWAYVFSTMVLSFQNCGPSFSANSSVVALDSVQGASIITAASSNNYSPGQNLSFSYNRQMIGSGPLVWTNLLNSTTTCIEISANNEDPYVVNCAGKGILSITLVVDSGTSGVVGPLTSDFIVNDGLPRSTSLVPFVITNATGDWNKVGVFTPPYVPPFTIMGGNFLIKNPTDNNAGTFVFKFNNNGRFLSEAVANWTLNAPGCTGVPSGNGNSNFTVNCPPPGQASPPPVTVTVDLQISGSDPNGGNFSIPPVSWSGTYNYSGAIVPGNSNGVPAPPAAANPDPMSANYIGAQGLLQTNVVFVGQTLRFFNKASATKQFGLNFNGTPCASTGPIPYTAAGDYSQFVDCKMTTEFGDPAVGSPIANAYDSSQNFYLIVIDGTKLFNNNCKLCHLDLSIARNQIGNETLDRLKQAIMGQAQSQPMLQFDNSYSSHLSNLTDPQKLAIIHALQN